jgi:hypothetical protein
MPRPRLLVSAFGTSTPADFGDGWLVRQGYTLAWAGFFRLQAPVAYGLA